MIRGLKNRLLSPFVNPQAGLFLAVVSVFGISAGLFAGILNNYLYEILHISKAGRGIVEFPRELPGLLLAGLAALMSRFCEMRMVRAALLISIAGLAGIAVLGQSLIPAIVMMVLWSTGEHLLMPLRQSVAVHMARKGREGGALGLVTMMQNLGQLAGYYMIPMIFLLTAGDAHAGGFPNYRFIFLAGLAVLVAGFILSLRLPADPHHLEREKLVFRKKYNLYYILETFFGARKQVFLTFAPYVLILIFGASAGRLALLYGISATLAVAVSPIAGRIIDRMGFRIMLVADAFIMILLCLIYGFSHSLFPKPAALVLVQSVFVLDSVLFVTSIARASYVKTISASRNEMTAALSTGVSINHLVSIVIAVCGGLLWESLGVEALFSVAAAMSLASFIFCLWLPAGFAPEYATGGSSGKV
ncbi:MFS transporter [bacterium]|nr:MFS transporter [bacterium]